MRLWTIISLGIRDQPAPLYDSETGAPSVYANHGMAVDECDLLNEHTKGGYLVVEGFEVKNRTKPQKNRETILRSSHGHVIFDSRTGLVLETDLDKGFGAMPIYVNIPEWQAAYPGETLGDDEHDILDFGFVSSDGEYEPPALEWRKDRERMCNVEEL